MRPKFTIGKNERLMIGEKYISNGHWLIVRKNITGYGEVSKKFKALENLQLGNYHLGLSEGVSGGDLPDFEAILPKREGYKQITEKRYAIANYDGNVESFVLESEDGTQIGIGCDYLPLLSLGAQVFIRDTCSPIIVLNSKDLNGDLMALVMPRRLDKNAAYVERTFKQDAPLKVEV